MKTPDISPREYHAQREAEKLRQREQLRRERLAQVRGVIGRLAPDYPSIEAIYLFGSIMQAGQFTAHSDIDVAVATADLTAESAFWMALEEALQRNVDVRPYQHPITQAVADYGECVYARESHHP